MRLAAIIFALALVVRLSLFLHLRDLEFFQVLGLDSRFYHEWAVRIAEGKRAYEPAFFQGPLYPWFLSMAYRVAGTDVLVAQLLQIVLGAASAALVYLLGERVFDRPTGILAGALFGLYGYLIYLETHLLIEPLLVFLLLTSLHLFLTGARRERWLPLAGLVVGAMALGRSSFLAAGLIALAAYVIWGRDVPARRRRRRVGLALAGMAVAVAPASLHNMRAGEPVLITANGGINYYIGNHGDADGMFVAVPGVDFFQPGSPHDGGSIAIASAAAGRTLGAAEASRYWLRRGLGWNLDNPARTIVLWGKKILMVFNDAEIPQIENYAWAQRESSVLRSWPVRIG